ncbi:MAG: ATP-dependent Clp protease proteolytic subunit, partial [Anaerococcus obesiensis]
MKKNNGKRWIAVAIALLLFVASSIVSNRSDKISEKQADKLKNEYLNQFNPFSATANKNIVEDGDKKNKIALISYEGAIGDGEVYDSFMEQLDDIYKDDSVKGVIMQVNSPGGAVYNSEQIANKIKEIQTDKKIPVFTVMKTMAASGGYYIS